MENNKVRPILVDGGIYLIIGLTEYIWIYSFPPNEQHMQIYFLAKPFLLEKELVIYRRYLGKYFTIKTILLKSLREIVSY